MRKVYETCGFASTSSLASTNWPRCSSARRSRTGPIMRHGWHQSAQKSTTTGRRNDSSRTSVWKVWSVTSTTLASSVIASRLTNLPWWVFPASPPPDRSRGQGSDGVEELGRQGFGLLLANPGVALSLDPKRRAEVHLDPFADQGLPLAGTPAGSLESTGDDRDPHAKRHPRSPLEEGKHLTAQAARSLGIEAQDLPSLQDRQPRIDGADVG